MGIATAVLGTMKFFRRKDKRKNDSGSGPSRMPGFGSSTNSKHATPEYGGYGLGNSGAESYRPFGSPPPGSLDRALRTYTQPGPFQPSPSRASAAALAQFPTTILERIFVFVCPHSRDESYETCEQSSVEDGCMLCDLRDLAHCVAVCKRWKGEAVKLLYVRTSSPPHPSSSCVLASLSPLGKAGKAGNPPPVLVAAR
jgi:hypothetical protein